MSPRALAVALVLAGCGGPATPPPSTPGPGPVPDAVVFPPTPEDPEPVAAPPPPPSACASQPPSHDSLGRPAQPGLLVIDAAAPHELGACISPQLALREGAVTCEPSGLRCRVGERHVLLAREDGEACVPIALVAYPSTQPDADAPEIEAALAMRDEACALHDRVVRADEALYAEVVRARRIAPSGRRGELAFECLTGDDARALASEVRGRFMPLTPLRCTGLRCVSESEPAGDPGSVHPPAGSLLFAHRLAGPLRFDGVAWLRSSTEIPRALELLRRRCR